VQVRGRGPGGGSGVIWNADGLIITNAHVARGKNATVELWDNRTFEGPVIARDEERDLAAIKITAADLPAAPVGDSTALRVGEIVVAVGNPLGMVGAVTTGIVHAASGVGRRQEWVQADVRLAPGNSGGPLANARGEVIGINSMIAGGLALAVPSSAVERFLATRGERPVLGVALRPVMLADRKLGLLVFDVEAGSAAESAGLMIGDILLGADGQPFTIPDDLAFALSKARSGAALRLDIQRGGQPLVITATITAKPADAEVAA
jgi:serine protease Do